MASPIATSTFNQLCQYANSFGIGPLLRRTHRFFPNSDLVQWPPPVLIVPTHGGMARLSRPGWLWLNTKMVYPQTVTHPSTNRARHRANYFDRDQCITTKPSSHLDSSGSIAWLKSEEVQNGESGKFLCVVTSWLSRLLIRMCLSFTQIVRCAIWSSNSGSLYYKIADRLLSWTQTLSKLISLLAKHYLNWKCTTKQSWVWCMVISVVKFLALFLVALFKINYYHYDPS